MRHRQPLTLLLVAVALAAAAMPCLAAAAAGRRSLTDMVRAAIVGGTAAQRGRYGWMASLRYDDDYWNDHFCGGMLIAPQIVLTAAHCLINQKTGDWASDEQVFPQVRLGGYELEGGSYEQRNVAYVYVHQEYDHTTSDHDIALLLLDRPSTRPRIRLPPSKPDPPVKPGTWLKAIGWGSLRNKGPSPTVLQEASLDFLNLGTCARFMPYLDWEGNSMICAGSPSRRKDTCQGDSGGPLFLPGKAAAQDLLVGIVSWGYTCAGSTPGVYTDVAYEREWIDANLKQVVAQRRAATGARVASTSRPAAGQPSSGTNSTSSSNTSSIYGGRAAPQRQLPS